MLVPAPLSMQQEPLQQDDGPRARMQQGGKARWWEEEENEQQQAPDWADLTADEVRRACSSAYAIINDILALKQRCRIPF